MEDSIYRDIQFNNHFSKAWSIQKDTAEILKTDRMWGSCGMSEKLIREETLSKKILEEGINHTAINTLILAYWWIDVSTDVGFIYIRYIRYILMILAVS